MTRPVPFPHFGEIRSFIVDGEERFLGNPDGSPTGRQLLALWHAGALALVLPDPANELFTKAQAAWAIDYLRDDS